MIDLALAMQVNALNADVFVRFRASKLGIGSSSLRLHQRLMDS